jgi:hypothetical protein
MLALHNAEINQFISYVTTTSCVYCGKWNENSPYEVAISEVTTVRLTFQTDVFAFKPFILLSFNIKVWTCQPSISDLPQGREKNGTGFLAKK